MCEYYGQTNQNKNIMRNEGELCGKRGMKQLNDCFSLLAPQADSDLMVFLAKERVVKKLSQSTSDRTRKIVNYPCIG